MRMRELESLMRSPDFWVDKAKAQILIRELKQLKAEGGTSYDEGSAVITIFAGAGGDDAEDWAAMLLSMYLKYFTRRGWRARLLHENRNDHGGYRNVAIEIEGDGSYGTLKHESGVHRLVRISPFNARKLRHTSFALVEVIPKFEETHERGIVIKDEEIKVEFAKSGGPGGQNVNKRETAVRIVHLATGISVHVDSERSQSANREKGLQILRAKLYHALEEERVKKVEGMYVSKTTDIEWGNQIRSYVLHPYKLVKDHRTGVEVRDAEVVLNGSLEPFIGAEQSLKNKKTAET